MMKKEAEIAASPVPRLDGMTHEQRQLFAENLKERVYSTITLIAVMTVMWQHSPTNPISAIGTIIGAVIAIWLATLVAARMSYRAVHGKAISNDAYKRTFFVSSGLLAPAIFPIFAVAIGGISGLYTIKTALFASIIVSLLLLFVISFVAGRRIYDSGWRLILVSLAEMGIGAVVVVLKLLTGE